LKKNTGKLAIVTGASTGIGYELAKCCAADGFNLLIAADEPEIHEAARVFKQFGVEVEALQADLATQEGVDSLYAATRGRPVHALLANAGRGLGHAFLDQDFEDIRRVVDTNIIGSIYLAQKFGRDMRARGEGRILFTGSIAGFMPGAFSAVYNGTKAFIDSFSFALRNELKDTGVTVTCLMPGATETEFFARADMLDTNVGQSKKDDPAAVAKAGFEAMMNGEGDVVTGWKNKLQAAAALVTPSDVLAEQHRKKAEPGSAKGIFGESPMEQGGKRKMSERSEGQEGVRDEAPNRESSAGSRLYASVTKHPLVTGGLVLAGAGLAYAAARAIRKSDESIARDVHIETSIAIERSPAELYAFWRDFKNLPLFMKDLESVTELGQGKSHWVAKAPGGARVEWDAEIYNEKENELIAWRSLENADVVNAGSVRFDESPEGRGAYVRVTLNYNPPAGQLGATLAQLLGADPAQLLKENLRRFKQLMETGEIATVEGQTSGRAKDATPAAGKKSRATAV
jgi:short-subunit dehydrogenase/uncharacterized membrane protein